MQAHAGAGPRTSVLAARYADAEAWGRDRLLGMLDRHLALKLAGTLSEERCRNWVRATYAAREDWTSAFGGEQFSLGRAWYTDFEEDRTREYFDQAARSDACVERWLPGAQSFMLGLLEELVGGRIERRTRWCGPGVHVFPAREQVAENGGVVHFDTEGLGFRQIERRVPAISLILMLQPPEQGGGVKVWDVEYAGEDSVDDEALLAPSATVESQAGDLVVLDSYRLHQIQAFSGRRDRISLTVMAAEIDRGRWESWF